MDNNLIESLKQRYQDNKNSVVVCLKPEELAKLLETLETIKKINEDVSKKLRS